MTEPDHYAILGVAPTADLAQIRQAYRRGVRDAHPDAGGDPERFHAVQTAYETLSSPTGRAEYDASRGIRRPRRRSPGRHAKNRRVREWRINTTTTTTATAPATTTATGDIMTRPWFIDINPHHRLRCTPSIWHRVLMTTTVTAAWLIAGAALTAAVLDDTADLAWQAILAPYLILSTAVVIATSVRAVRPRRPVAEGLVLALAAGIGWIGGLTQIPTLLAVHLATACLLPWSFTRLRIAARLRAAIRAVLIDFNAFGPAGIRPSADRLTAGVLRTLLERIPAARLFVHVPFGTRHADFIVVTGRRVAVITRTGPHADADLTDTIRHVGTLLAGTDVRGYVIWPHLPDDRVTGDDALIRHLSTDTAAGEIGRWLADEPYTLHLPTLRRLRDRLAQPPDHDAPPAQRRSSVHV